MCSVQACDECADRLPATRDNSRDEERESKRGGLARERRTLTVEEVAVEGTDRANVSFDSIPPLAA